MLFNLVVEIREKTGICIEFVNLGGGIGIPYKPEEEQVDYQKISKGIEKAYNTILKASGFDDINIFLENGKSYHGTHMGILLVKFFIKKIYIKSM